MPDWLQPVAVILIPLASIMLAMHTAARNDRRRLSTRVEHVHDCVEKRAGEQMQALHRLELRVVAIETRGHQVRRSDHGHQRAAEQEAP